MLFTPCTIINNSFLCQNYPYLRLGLLHHILVLLLWLGMANALFILIFPPSVTEHLHRRHFAVTKSGTSFSPTPHLFGPYRGKENNHIRSPLQVETPLNFQTIRKIQCIRKIKASKENPILNANTRILLLRIISPNLPLSTHSRRLKAPITSRNTPPQHNL